MIYGTENVPLCAGDALAEGPYDPAVAPDAGRSAVTKVRNVAVPADPFGAANTVFAVRDAVELYAYDVRLPE